MISAIITAEGTITAVVKGKSYVVNDENPRFDEIVTAINNQDEEKFLELWSIKSAVESWAGDDSDFTISEGGATYKGHQLHDTIAQRLLDMIKLGVDRKPMFKFLRNLYDNPSARSLEELYPFIEKAGMPITPDGCFLSYKGVVKYSGKTFTDVNGKVVKSGDLVDKHSRTIRNNIGDVVSMPRNQVSDNFSDGCARGLHAGSENYATKWGSETIIVKINPKNVVSVPDYSAHEKLRCCEYEVADHFESRLDDTYDERYSDDDDDCGEDVVPSCNSSNIKVGDTVKVERRYNRYYDPAWANVWAAQMDNYIGEEFLVKYSDGEEAQLGGYYFPLCVLTKVEDDDDDYDEYEAVVTETKETKKSPCKAKKCCKGKKSSDGDGYIKF